MQLSKILLLTLLSVHTTAQDIDNNDIPLQCRDICASVISLTSSCDRQNADTDSSFIACVCAGPNAAAEIPACEACVADYDRNDGHDNDVNDLVRSCAFTMASSTAMATGSVTSTAGTTAVTSSGASITSSAASSVSSSLAGGAGSLTSAVAIPTATANAAGKGTPLGLGVGAVVFVGALGFV